MGDSSSSSSYASLMERLEAPQPAMQRFAVMAVFDKLKNAPPHLGLKSREGEDALSRCLQSSLAAVTDQGVRQLCSLVEEGHMEPPQAFQHLHAALDAAPPHSVETFVKAIGFLSRLLYKHHSTHISATFSLLDQHPFLKVFLSRVDAHMELLQQVIMFVAEVNFMNYTDLAQFLRPLLTYTIMQISVSTAYTCFAQRLHSLLVSLSCTHPSQGLWIFRILVECIKFYPQRTAEEIGITIGFAEELVTAFEISLTKLTREVEQASICGVELSIYLMEFCSGLIERNFASSPALVLFKRLVLIRMDKDQNWFHCFDYMVVFLAHMLVIVEYEHEQLLLLNLSIIFLEWKRESGLPVSQSNALDCPVEMLLIFPVVHAMSSPSKNIKKTALSLLLILEGILEKVQLVPSSATTMSENRLCYGHRLGIVVHRLLQHICSQDQGLITWNHRSDSAHVWISDLLGSSNKSKVWLEYLQKSLVKNGEGLQSNLVSQPYKRLRKGIVLLLSMIVSALVVHPTLGSSATEALAAIGRFEPSLGVSFLLVVLFYLNFFRKYGYKSQELALDILRVVPVLACHSATTPLIIQTLQPMLHEDARRELRATAVRLLCRTWEFTNRVFVHLQKLLDPKIFSASASDMDLLISMAACVRDVCKKDADSGVDIILSIQACIESKIPTVQALGLESLAHLCESDVIDFYTAWVVVSKQLQDPLSDPVIANSLCILLCWGAMDAEAYPEASKQVLELIWEVTSFRSTEYSDLWVKARISAIQALSFYEVGYIKQALSLFPGKQVDLLISEHCPEVQQVTEGLVVKFLAYEHRTRRRLRKTERVGMNKVEKLMHALPRVLFSSERKHTVADIPGAALLSLTFSPPPKAMSKKVFSKDLREWLAKHENALLEIAGSIQLSRNICVALLSLQSWLPFMRRWLRAKMMAFEVEGMSDVGEQIPTMAGDSIFKDIRKIAEEAVPRAAENLALSLGALCMILPSSAHSVTPAATRFLLDWLHQDAHEYKQWSSAISLGLVSTCLHATDWKHKHGIIDTLLKVAGRSNRTLVIGACGVGLGFACQSLLNGDSVNSATWKELGTNKQEKTALLGHVVKSLIQLLGWMCPSAIESLQNLYQFELLNGVECNIGYNKLPEHAGKHGDNIEENVWGIAGLVIGLGASVVAIQKSGSPAMVVEITNILISWIPFVNSWQGKHSQSESFSYGDISAVSLAVGSSLALSTAVNICHKLELIDEGLDSLVNGFRILISKVACQKDHSYLYQNLLMASCIGSGNLLSCILNESAHPIKVEDVKKLLETIRITCADPNPPIVHFGGMIGIVNCMSAGAGLVTSSSQQALDFQLTAKQKETSYVRGPILSNPLCEQFSQSLIHEILGVVRESNDVQLQSSAAWALSFLRNAYLSRDQSPCQETNVVHNDSSGYSSPMPSQTFPEDSTVWRLCSLLLDPRTSEKCSPVRAITIVSVLRCLEKAPLLPSLDWGGLMRGFMRYKDHSSQNQLLLVSNSQALIHTSSLREACVHFSFVHAERIPSLLNFLDELCELSRFNMLENSLQSVLLLHMVDMTRIFSRSRMEKFFSEILDFIGHWLILEIPEQDTEQETELNRYLKIAFWKSLHKCLTEILLPLSEIYLPDIVNCMEILFQLLPPVPSNLSEMCQTGSKFYSSEQEWSQALKCLMNAPKEWLLEILQVKVKDSEENENSSAAVSKVIMARARLVGSNYIPHSELGKARSYLLNKNSSDIWCLLLEVAMALQHAAFDVKRQWLLDTIETGCITKYPSTALRFLGLLTGSWSPYAACLILDPMSVLQDLPFTFSSIFLDISWSSVLGLVVQKLLSLIDRICNWQSSLQKGECIASIDYIDRDEKKVCSFLLHILHQTCIALKDHLSFDVQFKLANTNIV